MVEKIDFFIFVKTLFLFIRRSLNLIECLLRIADTGLYPVVLDIFKHGIQRSGELIFLGLLQLHVRLSTELRSLLFL
jgi:hypothetical protein